MVENWVPVKTWKNGILHDFTGYYEVNNLGKIRTVEHYVKHNYGGQKLVKSHIVKQQLSKSGYKRVMFYKLNTVLNCSVQRIVYESFNGQIPTGMQVNHINEDKTDNRLENLNLMTPEQNSNWGTRNQRLAKSLSVPINQYDLDGNYICTWSSAREIEESCGFSHQNVQKCATGKTKTAYNYVWRYAS